ncbi:MAG: methyltransferase domain-containing protein [Chloroflexota bacterium]
METEEAERVFDEYADAYRAYWGPIIAPAAMRVLDRVLMRHEDTAFDLLDVGTGTGVLALAALERWPNARVTGVDPSARMLEQAADAGRRRWSTLPRRLNLKTASADKLPLPDQSVDVAVSSFVIQLVPSRPAALREIIRVLRPGGQFACVTWQDERLGFEPEEVFGDAIDELGIKPPEDDRDVHPYVSVRAAADEFRRAGFRNVRARPDSLEHRFTPESYLAVLEHWIERELFAVQGRRAGLRLREVTLRKLRRLRPEEFVWRRPLVSLVAVKPDPPHALVAFLESSASTLSDGAK